MTLVAVVLVFLFMQYGKGIRIFQDDRWLFQWNQWLNTKVADRIPTEMTTLLTIVIPSLAVAIVCLLIDDAFFGIPLLAALVLVLSFSLGRGDFTGLVNDYLASWNSGDFHSAFRTASQFSHGEILEQTEDASTLHKHAVQAMLYQGFERWFTVIFWLVAAGPFGALFYRISFLLANENGIPDENCNSTVCRVIYWLEWMPLRLFGISVAIVGNFGSSAKIWRDSLMHDEVSTEQRLMDYGLAALGEDIRLACQESDGADQQAMIIQGANQIEKLRNLLDRTVVFSVVIISLLIVF